MDRVMELHVQQGGQRLDRYLALAVPDLSRSLIQRLIEAGHVTVGTRVPKASYHVEAGDVVTVRVPPPEPIDVRPENIALSIVYEDTDILVVDKPAGMVVHPAHGHHTGTLVNALLAHCPDLAGVGGAIRPGIVHRLDKDTSGLMVVAKNDAAQHALQEQFKQRHVHKSYLALTEGILPTAHGVIDAPIGRDPSHRQRMAVQTRGREARTEYRVLEYFPAHSLVSAEPITGRTHQIRIHLAYIGHPVVGDRVYGFRKQRLPLERQFLHAARLAFELPSTGKPVEFSSALPPDLTALLEYLHLSTQSAQHVAHNSH